MRVVHVCICGIGMCVCVCVHTPVCVCVPLIELAKEALGRLSVERTCVFMVLCSKSTLYVCMCVCVYVCLVSLYCIVGCPHCVVLLFSHSQPLACDT